jgi:hypothetical protein
MTGENIAPFENLRLQMRVFQVTKFRGGLLVIGFASSHMSKMYASLQSK